jgi:hypothetical protein
VAAKNQSETTTMTAMTQPFLVCLGSALLLLSSTARVGATCDSSQPTRTPTSRYVIKDGAVYDKKTDLTWQRCSIGQRWEKEVGCVGVITQMTWEEAKAASADGWRLPTRDELATLASPTCKQPAINEESFPDMDLAKLWYWTGTESGEYLAWLVNFADGHFASYDRSDVGALRLVRSGVMKP